MLNRWQWDWADFSPQLILTYLRRPGLFHALLIAVWLLGGLVAFSVGQGRAQSHATIYRFAPAAFSAPVTPNAASTSTSASTAHTLAGTPTIMVAQIETVLAQYKSPAAGHGQALYDLGQQYGIDPAYALAFFIHESSAGTKGIAVTTHSLGNIRQTADSGFPAYQGFRAYPTWEAGMEDWYKLIKNVYINGRGLTTVESIIPVYAPSADHNDPVAYINAINNLVASWRSKR